MTKYPVFIGGAWPYANGSLHLGHIASLLPGDVLARYFRQNGHPVLYISGADCHGTPITVRAEQEGTHPAKIAAHYFREFKRVFSHLGFSYDLFWHTMAAEHHQRVQGIFQRLADKWLYEKTEEQAYCPDEGRFLSDRYVEGQCPACGADGARGDQCDACGVLLTPQEVVRPRCRTCGAVPVFRESVQVCFRLSATQGYLENLVESCGWRENAVGLTRRYLKEGLRDRTVTRDLDWGIDAPFPGFEDKKIYVWFDAVLGYLTGSQEWARTHGDWRQFWGDDARAYYVHGKDNIPFHTLILPGLLYALGETTQRPDYIVSSEYLTLEGRKISTSRNWAVWADDFLSRYQPDALRYYLTVNGPESRDADFSWDSFVRRTNDELLGAFGNLIHRTLSLAWNKLGGEIPEVLEPDGAARQELSQWADTYAKVGGLLEKAKIKSAVLTLFERIRNANKYIDAAAPWSVLANDPERGRNTLAVCVEIAANAAQLAAPFLPFTAEATLRQLGISCFKWSFLHIRPGRLRAKPEPLIKRLDASSVIDFEKSRLSTG